MTPLSLALLLGLALASPARADCPPGMADIDGAFCIDKWEAVVVDKKTWQKLSPYYTPNPAEKFPGARWQYKTWSAKPARNGTPMPDFPEVEKTDFEPFAQSKSGVYPQGFTNRALAKRACENAGKRLCKRSEWYKACVGPGGPTPTGSQYPAYFPYGPKYIKDKCNFEAGAHPLLVMGRSSSELDDPRLMLAEANGRRLLAMTGQYGSCVNGYGVYDMVGNQDEVIDDMAGDHMTFVGSFYARDQGQQPHGCASVITAHHATQYFDYSIGFRCCSDPE